MWNEVLLKITNSTLAKQFNERKQWANGTREEKSQAEQMQ